jgi:hypothetical protein
MRQVFHIAMSYILNPFWDPSKEGFTMECGDHVFRTLVPHFPIVCQDLEEASVWNQLQAKLY